jgi:hypothetical protein
MPNRQRIASTRGRRYDRFDRHDRLRNTRGNSNKAVYFRPFNFLRDDKSLRVHAVQDVAWPDDTWEKLRKGKPGVYQSAVKPIPDPSGWFHARIEVTKQKVSVWVDDAKEPCLVVDPLANREKGKMGLWVDSGAHSLTCFTSL